MFGMFGESEDGDSGGMGLLGALGVGLLGGLGSYKGQEDTNETNLQLGREQMAFQERMSGTAYQRTVADMEKAGINPMMVAKLGGASTPSGSLPQMENSVGTGIASAVQGAGLVTAAQQIENNKAQVEQTRATTAKIESETMEKNLNTARAQWELAKLKEETGKTAYEHNAAEASFSAMNAGRGKTRTGFEADVEKRKAEADIAKYGIGAAKAESEFYTSDYGINSPYIKSILEIMRGISSATKGR